MIAMFGLETSEAKLAAQDDYAGFWKAKIAAAKSRGKNYASNFRFFSNSRCDEAYIEALGKVLGKDYKVEFMKGQWGGEWTSVTW
jgi:hypothetical protein